MNPFSPISPRSAAAPAQTKRWTAMKESHQEANYNLWDGNDHYFTLVLDSYYGETPHAPAVIKVAPVQFHPLPTTITMNTLATGGLYGQLTWTGGSFDTSTAAIDPNLMFTGTFEKTDHTTTTSPPMPYTLYTPVVANYSTYDNYDMFHLVFHYPSGSTEQTNVEESPSSVANPVYAQSDVSVYLRSNVLLKSSRLYFISPGSGDPEGVIGTLKSNEYHTQFWIEAGPNYKFANINIIYTP